jgi:hypothetical protein
MAVAGLAIGIEFNCAMSAPAACDTSTYAFCGRPDLALDKPTFTAEAPVAAK